MKGRTKVHGVQLEGAEENILTYEGERVDVGENCISRHLRIVLYRYADDHFRGDGMVVECGRNEGEF
jgi:hypothetical protein